MPDVFVSHTDADKTAVDRIHDALEAAGLNVWVDHRDGIGPGDNWSAQIQQALNDCIFGLYVLSPASARSPECEAEYRRIMMLEKRLYVALVAPIDKKDFPWRLTTNQYVDLSKNFDAGLAELTRAIRGRSEFDAESPVTAVTRPITGIIDRRLTAIPIRGRDADLAELRRLLERGPVAILGVGGFGKSRLAAELVLTADVDGAIWHKVDEYSLDSEVLVLLREHFNLDPATERRDVLAKLRTNRRLVVLDNAESVPADDPRRADYVRLVDELHANGARVLLTSRVEWDDLEACRAYTPRTLVPEAARQMALNMAEAFGVQKPDDHVDELVEAARLHPELIRWAVKKRRKFEPKVVIQELRDLKSKDVQQALDEMIVKTRRQMTDAEGDTPEALLRRLNVCRGGFTYAAAKAIGLLTSPPDPLPEFREGDEFIPTPNPSPRSGEGLQAVLTGEAARGLEDFNDALAALQTWQFVAFDTGAQRYSIDQLVIAAVGEDNSAHRPHYDFYLALAQDHDETQDYAGLDVESANLEAAFEWAIVTGDGEDALRLANACGSFWGNRGRFDLRLDWFERVTSKLEKNPDKMLWANGQNGLGLMLQEHPLDNRRENLRRAIAAYEAALEYRTPAAAPIDYAKTQNNLGNAYTDLAKVEDRENNLRRAIAAYETALEYRTPTTTPLDYALTQNNLGAVYRDLSEIENREDNLRRAVAACEVALEYFTPMIAPLYYAMTQNNLGIAHHDLAQIEDREGNLRRAIAAYEAALKYYTPATAPQNYATTQNNIGAAYADLAKIEARENTLRRAIAAYEAALEYRSPAAAPLDYAMTQCNLGLTYRALAQIEDGESNLRRAVAAYEAALKYFTPVTAPLYYAITQHNLGNAYQNCGDLSAAVACWGEAEKYYRQMGDIEQADLMLKWIQDAEARLASNKDAKKPKRWWKVWRH